MAISRITSQDASNAATVQTLTATYPATPTQGNLLIACGYAAVGVFQQSMSSSGWSVANATINPALTNNLVIWYKIAGASESTSVTTTQSAGVNKVMRLQIYEYTTAVSSANVGAITVLDQGGLASANGATSDTATTSAASNTVTTTNANCLLFCGISWTSGITGGSQSWDSSFTTLQTDTRMTTANRIVSATGTYAPTCSWTTSRAYDHALTAFAEIYTGGFYPMFL